jgi:F-type H+-transporting ATPase subunit b
MRRAAMKRFSLKSLFRIFPAMMVVLGSVAVSSASGGVAFDPIFSMAMLWRIINFIILAAVLYKFMAQPMRDFLASRREEILNSLEQAKQSKEKAEARYKDLSQRLENRDQEFEEIRKSAIENAEKQKEQIIAAAHDSARKMEEKARASIQQELKMAQESLKQEAAEMALKIAEEKLLREIKSGDHERFMDNYIAGLK